MERLDACYFCGTAADAPLQEVSISPRDRRGEPDAAVTVTLCPTCEDKLERVLAGVFDHVESRDSGGARPATDEAADDPEAAPAGGGRIDRIDVGSGAADGTPDASPPAERSGDAKPSASDAREAAAAADRDDAEGDESRAHARATAGGPAGLDGVSVDEYNRVMRLLKNREFPMPRSTFVDLATSAYDLGEATVEQVLDAVIDRGGLVERGDELARPEAGGDGSP
ncbi:MAG: hypothetical protein ABEJ92_06875 [Halobacteriales archaeon]